jgi:hypothetical protein
VWAELGERERALDALKTAYASADPELSGLRVNPHFAGLRPDPRYGELLRKIGLDR